MPSAKTKGSSRKIDKAPKKGKLNGWAAVAEKQQEFEERKERQEQDKNKPRDFWLKAGETAVIQFLSDEPHTFDGHSIKNKRGDYRFVPCQLSEQKYCLMCREDIRQSWKAAFKVLDYRGNWEKDEKAPKGKGKSKGKFLWDEQIEKISVVNMTILGQLQAFKDKRKKELTEMVLEVTRTGSGKNDTSYNFSLALDEDDEKMVPVEVEEQFPDISELIKPLTDEELVELGFEKPDNDD